MPDHHDKTSSQKLKQVFTFLREYSAKNEPVRRVLTQHPWVLALDNLPAHSSVSIATSRDSTDETLTQLSDLALLEVSRPSVSSPPPCPASLTPWLDGDISDPHTIPVWRNEVYPLAAGADSEEPAAIRFTDDEARMVARNKYEKLWQSWAAAERPTREALQLFERLFELYSTITRDSEGVELVIGDGILVATRPDGPIEHPVLTQRVELSFDPNGPTFRVSDSDRAPELELALLHGFSTLNTEMLAALRTELASEEYHPLGGEETSSFLRRLVQQLDSRGAYLATPIHESLAHPTVYRRATLMLRKRSIGFAAAFDRVIQDLEASADIPVGLSRLVGVDVALTVSGDRSSHTPWSEPVDVLLTKPANAEQILLARALEDNNAVLVQGPPGTGKSHTIANLIGHLVSQGKRVLVTSHTTKALRVLRDHLPEEIRSLCVSVLDTDLESRKELEVSVQNILSRLSTDRPEELQQKATQSRLARSELLDSLRRLTSDLRTVRASEYEQLTYGGRAMHPSEASRWVTAHAAQHSWIPGPLSLDSPLPLSVQEVAELYSSNGAFDARDMQTLGLSFPPSTLVPPPAQVAEWLETSKRPPTRTDSWWIPLAPPLGIAQVRQALDQLDAFAQAFNELGKWQHAIVAAGHANTSEKQLWTEIAESIATLSTTYDSYRLNSIDSEVSFTGSAEEADDTASVLGEIATTLAPGKEIGALSLMFNARWKAALRLVRVNNKEPRTVTAVRLAQAYLHLVAQRRRVERRWQRLCVPETTLPLWSELPSPPEPALAALAPQFRALTNWWSEKWEPLDAVLQRIGFRWAEFQRKSVADDLFAPPLERDVSLIRGGLKRALVDRLDSLEGALVRESIEALAASLQTFPCPPCQGMSQALRSLDIEGYNFNFREYVRLLHLKPIHDRRVHLLSVLAPLAPTWAEAIRNRHDQHGSATAPGDPHTAWTFRQLDQELRRRSALDEKELLRSIHDKGDALRRTTVQLVDSMAWLAQHERTDLKNRLALQGWADIQSRVGRGKGVRVPKLLAEGRRLLESARSAVPVWVMPLSRVVDSFSPDQQRFDVVIIDEASQMDVRGLLAWYLGKQIAVVGDHEQVSPSAVGEKIEDVERLISQHLSDIPNRLLYDGKNSVYHLARTCFGGSVVLREHFRCVPDIIQFSNHLSYNGIIQPLRDATAVPLPHVAEYIATNVRGGVERDKTNLSEARAIAALMLAVSTDTVLSGKSIGAITLVGDEQAQLIQKVALELLGTNGLLSCRFLVGNPAQFQGDERDIVFLSMVERATGRVLSMRQTDMFKQRFNVAASRARDQLWLVHSLDPASDLQPGDLRRRLIDHVRNPTAMEEAIARTQTLTESPFEREVVGRLIEAGYAVQPQVRVGGYRIDMVVSSGLARVALECDGEAHHGPDQLESDLNRQAVLERVGWIFVRLRGIHFYRDRDHAMRQVFEELASHGVTPQSPDSIARASEASTEARDRIVRRALEVMREHRWIADDADALALPPSHALSSDV